MFETEEPQQDGEFKGLMWVLNQPWLETRKTDTVWTPEEVRGLQIELVVTIAIVISLFFTMVGCCCLRLPHRSRKGLRHLAHALRVWKSKLPQAKEWTIWTCITATCSGFTHCMLCCLYKKDEVRNTQNHVEASNEFELNTLDSQGRRVFSDWRRGLESERSFATNSLPRDEEGFSEVQLTSPTTYELQEEPKRATLNRGTGKRASHNRRKITYYGPTPNRKASITVTTKNELYRPTYPPPPPPVPAPRKPSVSQYDVEQRYYNTTLPRNPR